MAERPKGRGKEKQSFIKRVVRTGVIARIAIACGLLGVGGAAGKFALDYFLPLPPASFQDVNLTPENMSVRDQLQQLVLSSTRGNISTNIAPRAAYLGVDHLCNLLKCDEQEVINLKQRMHFLNRDDFVRKYRDIDGCSDYKASDSITEAIGVTNSNNGDMYFNISEIESEKDEAPAVVAFEAGIHESIHSRAKKVIEPSPTIPTSPRSVKGLGVHIPFPQLNMPGKICYKIPELDLNAEETVTHFLTTERLADIGIIPKETNFYTIAVERYRKSVIERLFNGDYLTSSLLQYQGDNGEFFFNIGRSYNALHGRVVTGEQAYKEGRTYFQSSVMRGNTPN